MTQQEFLRVAKQELGLEWDDLADQAGITPRTLKTYRMPETSKNYRTMPSLARAAVERLLEGHRKKTQKA